MTKDWKVFVKDHRFARSDPSDFDQRISFAVDHALADKKNPFKGLDTASSILHSMGAEPLNEHERSTAYIMARGISKPHSANYMPLWEDFVKVSQAKGYVPDPTLVRDRLNFGLFVKNNYPFSALICYGLAENELVGLGVPGYTYAEEHRISDTPRGVLTAG